MAYSYREKAQTFSESKSLVISKFLGVDYTTSSFNVTNNHAINAKNILRRDKTNILQKRLGILNLCNIDQDKIFYNFWSFVDTDGVEHYIANINGGLYALTFTSETPSFSLISQAVVLSKKVSAFSCNNRLYILGGLHYLMLEYKNNAFHLVQVVNSEYAYCPTTTIGITPVDSTIAGRQSLDAVNLISWWRKNRLVSGTNYTSDTDHTVVVNSIQTFQLDTSITYKSSGEMNDVRVIISFYDANNAEAANTNASQTVLNLIAVKCAGVDLSKIDTTKTETIIGAKDDDTTRDGAIYILLDSAKYDRTLDDTIATSIVTVNNTDTLTGYDAIVAASNNQKVYGYLKLDGSITLLNDYPNSLASSNIIVKFPHYTADKENNSIDKCVIGIVHTNNNFNSLFICGDTDNPSTDWHTEEINADTLTDEELNKINTKDLVYFPDTSYCNYGQDNKNPIIGYDNLGTGSLLVLKKYQNYEPTIYFRTGSMVAISNAVDVNGDALYKQEYSLDTGNIGNSAINYQSMCNFKGDTLFLANDNTIEGLDKETKAYDTQRYSNTRSYYIDKYLKDKNLNDAFFFVDDDYLYFVNNDEVFVNDYGDKTDSNYEWYHLKFTTNIGAMIKIKDKVYFGDKNGGFYLFANNGSYEDIKRVEFPALTLLTNVGGYVTTEKSLLERLLIGDQLEIKIPLISKLGDLGTDFLITDNSFTLLTTSLSTQLKSKIKVVYNGNVYDLIHNDGTSYTLANSVASGITETMTNGTMYFAYFELTISSIDIANVKLKFNETTTFAISQSITAGYFKHSDTVKCNYMTAPYVFGTLMYYKNLHNITLTNDYGISSEIGVEYIDDNLSLNQLDFEPQASFGTDLGTFSFENANFEGTNVPVRLNTFRLSTIRKKYTAFNFYNEKKSNCVLSAAMIEYSYGTRITI